ncbi:MAG: phosphate/phosphite/phosphonate ABC transporter substrate-binding protein [Candidatus Schekmanbacteria bacterium]|nr:phosphate/phosphite/phosphonate ABC transporter substrate-binding protein [Candidatus Schekmanbacteria bacterium]
MDQPRGKALTPETTGRENLATHRAGWPEWVPLVLLAGAVFVAGVALLIARRSESERLPVDLSRTRAYSPAHAAKVDALGVAVATMLAPASNADAYLMLIEYLGEKLGSPAHMIQRPSYAAINQLIERRLVDVAFICSGAYVILEKEAKADLLVVPVVDGSTTYQSLIIVHPRLEAKSFSDLRGSTFAYVDTLSNTGYLYPRWRILDQPGEREDYFRTTIRTHSHEKSIQMVRDGLVDGAAVDSLVYAALLRQQPELGELVRIVERSEPFGIPPVVIRKGLPPDFRAKLQQIFLNMHRDEKGRRALGRLGVDRFAPGDSVSYASVDEMLRELQRSSF